MFLDSFHLRWGGNLALVIQHCVSISSLILHVDEFTSGHKRPNYQITTENPNPPHLPFSSLPPEKKLQERNTLKILEQMLPQLLDQVTCSVPFSTGNIVEKVSLSHFVFTLHKHLDYNQTCLPFSFASTFNTLGKEGHPGRK